MGNWRRLSSKFIINMALIIASFVAIFPIVWIIKTSFGTRVISISYPPDLFFKPTLKNYIDVLKGDFPRYLLNSGIVVFFTVVVVMVLGTFAGYSLARFKIRGRETWFFYMLTTRMGPPARVT